MKKLGWPYIQVPLFLGLVLLMLMAFQNCEEFKSLDSKLLPISSKDLRLAGGGGGDGVPFDIKLGGEYQRIIPGHTCQGQSMPYSTLTFTSDGIVKTSNINNLCDVKELVSRQDVRVPSFANELVGYDGAVFTKSKNIEMWCTIDVPPGLSVSDDIYNVLIEKNDLTGQYSNRVIIDRFGPNGFKFSEFVEEGEVIKYIRVYHGDGTYEPRVRFYRPRGEHNAIAPGAKGMDAFPYELNLNAVLIWPVGDGDRTYDGRIYSINSWFPVKQEIRQRCVLGGDLDKEALLKTGLVF